MNDRQAMQLRSRITHSVDGLEIIDMVDRYVTTLITPEEAKDSAMRNAAAVGVLSSMLADQTRELREIRRAVAEKEQERAALFQTFPALLQDQAE